MVSRLAVAAVGLLLLAGACAPDEVDETDAVDETAEADGADPAEAAYLDGVRAAQAIRDEEIEELIAAVTATYQTQDRLFDVAGEIELRAATDEALAAAEDLTPPPGFRDDHDSWVESMADGRAWLEEAQDALERGDLLEMIVAFMRSELALAERLPDWSEEFCRAAVPLADEGFAGGPDVVCLRRDSIPGGQYGEALHVAVLRTELAVVQRIGLSGLPSFSDQERLDFLKVIQPEVEEIFAATLETVRGLDPPDELADDHALVVGFYEDILAVAQDITAAAEANDLDAFQSAAQASLEPGRALKGELSDDAASIVGMFTFFTP